MTGRMSELHILEPWSVLLSAELLSLDVTKGHLRVRVAGSERVYIGTGFRVNEVRLPLHHVMALGMPGGVISIAKALPDVPEVPLGEPSSTTEASAHGDEHNDKRDRGTDDVKSTGRARRRPRSSETTVDANV